MSEHNPTPAPVPNYYLPTTPAPKPTSKLKLVVIVAAVLAGLCVIGSIIGAVASVGGKAKPNGKPIGNATSAPVRAQQSQPVSEPTTEPAPAPAFTPTAKNFTVGIKILKSQCFGSAGCNVTYRVELAYNGPDLAEDSSYEITYEIRGGESGPVVGTITTQGSKYTHDDENFLSTSGDGYHLKAVITSIEDVS